MIFQISLTISNNFNQKMSNLVTVLHTIVTRHDFQLFCEPMFLAPHHYWITDLYSLYFWTNHSQASPNQAHFSVIGQFCHYCKYINDTFNHVPYKKILYCGSNQHKGNCTHHNHFVGFLSLGRIYNWLWPCCEVVGPCLSAISFFKD